MEIQRLRFILRQVPEGSPPQDVFDFDFDFGHAYYDVAIVGFDPLSGQLPRNGPRRFRGGELEQLDHFMDGRDLRGGGPPRPASEQHDVGLV